MAAIDAPFIVITPSGDLPNERTLTPGSGMNGSDGGAGGNYTLSVDPNLVAFVSGATFVQLSGTLQRTGQGVSYLVAGSGISIVTASNGQIFIASTITGSGAPTNSQYLVLSADPTLSNERVLTAGTGLSLSDGGAGGAATLSVNDNVVAFISGSSFTRLSGSLQRTSAGLSYIVSQGAISVVSSTAGQIFISASAGAPLEPQYLLLSADPTLPNERVFTPGTGLSVSDGGAGGSYTVNLNANTVAFTSGSTFTQLSGSLQRTSAGTSYLVGAPGISIVSGTATSAGQVVVGINNNILATVSGTTFTGPVLAGGGLSGSLQTTTAGLSYLVAQGALSITSQSNGQIILSASGGSGGGSGAPTDASYVTLGTNASLSNERVLTPGTGLLGSDAGANGNYTLSINNNVVATTSGSTFSGATLHTAGISGSLTQLTDGRSYVVALGGTTIVSQSNGQIFVSSSRYAPTESTYITIANDPTLTSERALAVGGGITLTDGGAGSSVTLGVNNATLATISGSTFTQLSGSLQRTAAGTSFIAGAPGVNVLSGTATSSGQIIIGLNDSFVAMVSGSTFSGVTRHTAGLSGSLTQLVDGRSFIVGTGAVTVTSSSNGQIIISGSGGSGGGGGGAPVDATYLALSTNGTLTNERVFTPGSGLIATDGGAGSTYTVGVDNNVVATTSGSTFAQLTGSLQSIAGGLSYLVGGTNISVVSASNGQVTIGVPAGTFAGVGNAFVTIGAASGLTAERALTAGTGIVLTDGGANSNVTLGVDNNVVATISGSRFTGPVVATTGLSGSLTQLANGSSYLVAGSNVTITSASNGQVFISSTGGGGVTSVSGTWRDPGNTFVTTGSISIDSSNRTAATIGTDVFMFVSGTTGLSSNQAQRRVSVFGGDVVVSGTVSGSIHQTAGGLSYLVAANNIVIASQSNGQIIFSGPVPGGDRDASYVLMGVTASLPNERVLTAGNGLTLADGGAGSTATFAINNNVVATVSGTNFTGASSFGLPTANAADAFVYVSGSTGRGIGNPERRVSVFAGDVVASGTISGSIHQTVGGLSYLVAVGGISITSQSNGQILISGSSITGGGGGGGSGFSSGYWSAPAAGTLVTTGSVSIDASNRQPTALGTDVYFFVSGSQYVASGSTNRRIALFGGDVMVSGAFVVASASGGRLDRVQVGTDTNFFVSGSQFIAAGSNRRVSVFGGDTWVSGALVVASASGGRTQTIQVGTDTTVYISGSQYVPAGTNRRVAVLAGDAWVSGSFVVASGSGGRVDRIPVGTDAALFVSGTQRVLVGTNRRVSVFGGDVFASGTVVFSSGTTPTTLGSDVTFYVSGSRNASLASGARRVIVFAGDTVVTGTVMMSNASVDAQQRTPAAAAGTDCVFFVSGSANRPIIDGVIVAADSERAVAVFGGDIITSGTLQVRSDTAVPKRVIALDNTDGNQYNIVTSNYTGASLSFGSSALYNSVEGYATNLYGYNGGCSAYDGRNTLTTDLACVSQYLVSNSATTTSSTSQDSNLTFAVVAGETWVCEASLLVTCSGGTGGVKVGFSDPGGGGGTIAGHAYGSAATLPAPSVNLITTFGAQGAFSTANGGTRLAWMKVVITAAASGNITVQFASVTATQTTQLIAGSYLIARRCVGV